MVDLCPPMKLGEVCEHQGGTFNTFLLEGHTQNGELP